MNVDVPLVPKATDSGGKQIAKQVLGIVLAGVFLWLAFRNTDFPQLWEQVKTINLWWILAVAICSIFSHWLRALRWTIMLRPLSDKRIGLWNAFCAVMIGYAVNIAVPRGGEVARVISISKTEHLPWVGVLPTMFIDRLLDLAMLVFLVGTTLVMLPPDIRESFGYLVPTGVLLCVATIVGLGLLPFAGLIITKLTSIPALRNKMPDKVFDKVLVLSEQFDKGTSSLRNPVGLLGIALLSFLIWGFYFFNFYLAMFAFGMERLIDVSHALIIFTIGSASVLVPTPGSVGTYHYAVSQALQKISHIDASQAMAYATISHAVSFVFAVCLVAAVCFVVQQASSRKDQVHG